MFGRIYDELGVPTWVEVTTDAAGYSDYVFVTALIQCIKLNINESPFFADWGIPAYQSLIQQIAPDFFVALMQQRFAPQFASLIIGKRATFTPTYDVNIITHQGVKVAASIPR